MRLGQVEEFLLAFHQAQAGNSAGAYGNERLDDVKSALLTVRIRVHERQDAVAAPGDVEHEEIENGERGRERVSKIAQAHAGHVEDAGGDPGAGNRRTEIGLK